LNHARDYFATGKDGAHKVYAKALLPLFEVIFNERPDGPPYAGTVNQGIERTNVAHEIMHLIAVSNVRDTNRTFGTRRAVRNRYTFQGRTVASDQHNGRALQRKTQSDGFTNAATRASNKCSVVCK